MGSKIFTNPNQFPLPRLIRDVVEAHKEEAEKMLAVAEGDVRQLLDGRERSAVFHPDSDPVGLLIQAARQDELCRVVLKMDEEARNGRSNATN